MQVTLASRRSPDATSNEDFIAATAACVVVVDGASVPPELGTGCAHGTAWFARRLGTQLLALVTSQPDHSPADNLAQAITDVAALHADTCDLDHPGTPSARSRSCASNQTPSTTWSWGTDDPAGAADRHPGDHRRPAGTGRRPATRRDAPAGHRHRSPRPSSAQLVTEQRRHRNHPNGFWVASTDPAAAHHALVDTVARESLHRAAVLSDGATRLVDRFGLVDWSSFLAVLAEQGPDAIIAQVQRPNTATRMANAGRVEAPRRRLGRVLPTDLLRAGAWDSPKAVLVVGASFSHHAQGGGIWPNGPGMPDPQPQDSTNQPGTRAGHRPAPSSIGRFRWLHRLPLAALGMPRRPPSPGSKDGQTARPGNRRGTP